VRPVLTAVYFGSAIFHGVLPVVAVLISRYLINDIVLAIDGTGSTNVSLWLGALFLVTLLDAFALLIGTRYIPKRLEDELIIYITSMIMEHANRLPLKLFEDLSFQDTLERAQQQMALNYIGFLRNIVEASIGFIQIMLLFLLLVAIEPLMIIVVVLAFPPYSAIMWVISHRRYTAEYKRAPARRWIRYYTELMLQRANATEIRLLGIGQLIIGQFQSFLQGFATENARIEKRATAASVAFVGITLSLFYVLFHNIVQKVISGSLTVGDIAVVVGAVARLSIVAEQIVSRLGLALERSLYVANLQTYLDIPAADHLDTDIITPELYPPIEFQNVSFSYPNRENQVLQDVSFTIRAGETVAIVGENGAGKSTIVKLLAKIYDPDEGTIWIGNHNLSELPAVAIQKQIGFVLQDFVHFEATVADNIGYGNVDKYLHKPEKIAALANKLEIAELIENMPEGYDTFIGRRFGTYDLSGGQWQQLAIARAFTRDTPFLVLDEPTASLDARTEHRIFSRFAELATDRTTLLISHRFTTVSMADRILVLANGTIAEQGTHEELIEIPNGVYAQLYRLHYEQF
jgi:ATP-binding cassette subfamily B protein